MHGYEKQMVTGFLFFTTAGIIYGILIELFATKVFKAKAVD